MSAKIQVTVVWSKKPAIYFLNPENNTVAPARFVNPTLENLKSLQEEQTSDERKPLFFALRQRPTIGSELGENCIVADIKGYKEPK